MIEFANTVSPPATVRALRWNSDQLIIMARVRRHEFGNYQGWGENKTDYHWRWVAAELETPRAHRGASINTNICRIFLDQCRRQNRVLPHRACGALPRSGPGIQRSGRGEEQR